MVDELENQDNEKKNQANGKICISMPLEQIKAIDEKRGLIPRSSFISDIVAKASLEKDEDKEES